MEVTILLLILIIIMISLQISLIVLFKKVSDSLLILSYKINNNNTNINLELKTDIMEVNSEIGKIKNRIKKLEMSGALTKHKIDNVSKEVSANNPLYRNKKLH